MFWTAGMMVHGMVRELQEGWCWRSKEVQVGPAGWEPLGHAGCLDFIPGPQAEGCKIRYALSMSRTAWKKGEAGDGKAGNEPCPRV